MKEIILYEAFNGLRFEKKEECEEYEAKNISKIRTEGIEWYDENCKSLEMNLDNWNKVKLMKFEGHDVDSDFYHNFSSALTALGKEQDKKFDEYCNTDIWGKTLIIWDEEKEKWAYFEEILRAFEKLKIFMENCKKISE